MRLGGYGHNEGVGARVRVRCAWLNVALADATMASACRAACVPRGHVAVKRVSGMAWVPGVLNEAAFCTESPA